MRSTTKKLLALSAAVSLGLAACGGEDEVATPAVSGEAAVQQTTTTTTEAPSATATDDAVDDPAATLRATLASLLQEHVYLTGAALETVLDEGADDATTDATLDALDENTVAIGDVVASIPGVEDEDEFVETWRDHIDDFVDYAEGRSTDDEEMVEQALAGLAEYQQTTADLLEQATEGELSSDDVFGELQTHVDSITAVVDTLAGQGEEGADPFVLLRDAADHMEAMALAIADAVAAAHEDEFAGDPNSVPARTRAVLTTGLQQQVYLAALVAEQAAEAGSTSDPTVQAASALLLGGMEDLANTVGGATGTSERESFLDAWRPYVDALRRYIAARTTGDTAGAETARAELDAAADGVAAALAEIAGGVDVAALLDTHVATITTAIDSLAAHDPAAYAQVRQAAQVMPQIAEVVSAGIVQVSAAEDAAEGQGAEGGTDAGEGTQATSDGAAEGTTSGGTAEEEPEPATNPSEQGGPEPEGGS